MKQRNAHNEITLAQQCYDILQDEIIEGKLLPGQKLKVAHIKERLEVGQSPVREALSRLVTTGLVESEDNKGFRVSKISETDIRDIYHTYLDIELLALTKAIKLGGLAWQSNIVRTLYELETVETKNSHVSYEVWAERNYNFHVALIAGCNSPSLLQVRADIYKRFDRYCRISFNIHKDVKTLTRNHKEHTELADAVLKRDMKKIETLMTHHIIGSLEDVINQLKTNNLL